MVRVNVNCVVDAKKTYLQSFVPKVSPAVLKVFRGLVSDAEAIAAPNGKSKEERAQLSRYIGKTRAALVDLLEEVPDWTPSLIQEVVNKLRAECPPYMKLFEKIFLATGVILNTLHSKENAHRPNVVLPDESEVAHAIIKGVAAELEKDPDILLDRQRGRELMAIVNEGIKAAVLRMIPVEDIAESGDEDSQVVGNAAKQPDVELSAIANDDLKEKMPPSGSSSDDEDEMKKSQKKSRSPSPRKSRSLSTSRSPSPVSTTRQVRFEDGKPSKDIRKVTEPADNGW